MSSRFRVVSTSDRNCYEGPRVNQKKRVIEMNQNCPRGGFVLKRTADLQLFLPRPGVVASVLLSPEIDDEVLVMSLDLPVSVMFEEGTTAAVSHDFNGNLEHFLCFFLAFRLQARTMHALAMLLLLSWASRTCCAI
mmetsp:Transcript_8984/g.16290  ORF Transcript_8984/g.16290 Transcript_8984/m.16290 type:complete len:136 (+) Transcript_8984:1534-1941(+)